MPAILDHWDPPPDVHATAIHIMQDDMKQVWRANQHLNMNSRLEDERSTHNRDRQTERQIQSCCLNHHQHCSAQPITKPNICKNQSKTLIKAPSKAKERTFQRHDTSQYLNECTAHVWKQHNNNIIYYLFVGFVFVSHLYGCHLSVPSPAKALKLQWIVTKPYRTPIHGGPILHLKLHMVQVGEIMIWSGSKQTQKNKTAVHVIPAQCNSFFFFLTHCLHLGPSTLGLHRQRPYLSSQACPIEPPISHWHPTHTQGPGSTHLLFHALIIEVYGWFRTLAPKVVCRLEIVVSVFAYGTGPAAHVGFTVTLAGALIHTQKSVRSALWVLRLLVRWKYFCTWVHSATSLRVPTVSQSQAAKSDRVHMNTRNDQVILSEYWSNELLVTLDTGASKNM